MNYNLKYISNAANKDHHGANPGDPYFVYAYDHQGSVHLSLLCAVFQPKPVY